MTLQNVDAKTKFYVGENIKMSIFDTLFIIIAIVAKSTHITFMEYKLLQVICILHTNVYDYSHSHLPFGCFQHFYMKIAQSQPTTIDRKAISL